MYCKNCGEKLEPGHAFCKKCGTPASKTRSSAAPNRLAENRQGFTGWVKKHKKQLIIGGLIFVGLAVVIVWLSSGNSSASSNVNAQQAVVDIICDTGNGGSGTIFTAEGTVLTNNHVIAGAKLCQVTIPDPSTGGIAEIYDAAPVIVPTLSKQYDVATLKIDGAYTDTNGKTWGSYPTTFTPFELPSSCDPTTASQLGDSVRIYGYPVTSGGYNLTVTDGVISSFADSGEILTSAKVDSGNSGGLAIDQNGCWLGIPSAVVGGNYQNLGVIIPGSIVQQFLNNVPAKLDPIAASTSTNSISGSSSLSNETDDQQCQDNYGTYSQASGHYDSAGKPTCVCQTGYSWDTTGAFCTPQMSLQQSCQANYGTGSYSHVVSGKSICSCSSGYVWNTGQTECVVAQASNDQICQDTFGPNSQWTGQVGGNGKPACNCQSGYSWDATGNSCALQTSLDQGCLNTFGTGSYSYTQGGKAVCGCGTGYTWNSGQTACVVAASTQTGYQVCSNAFPNETWDGTYSSDGKYNCVCAAGYTYNAATQSCE
jgi:S1-C subfamily serine protease